MSTSKIDRAALIEAAAEAVEACLRKYPIPRSDALQGSIGWGASTKELGSAALDAVLPQIADAIEARAEFWGYPGDRACADVARLVRELGDPS